MARIVQISLELDDILHEVNHVMTLVIEKDLDSLVDEWIMHEVAIDRAEVILQDSSQGQAHVNDSVGSQGKHIVLEVRIKDLFCLVHDLFAHKNE